MVTIRGCLALVSQDPVTFVRPISCERVSQPEQSDGNLNENNNPETGLTDVSDQSFTLVDHLQTRVRGLTCVDSIHEPPKDNLLLHEKQG